MIYFDNAATSYKKPPSVIRELLEAVKKYGGDIFAEIGFCATPHHSVSFFRRAHGNNCAFSHPNLSS